MVFDDFMKSQEVSYLLLKNSVLKGKLSHAYLVDANNNENAYDFVLAFVKMIVCKKHYSNQKYSECESCNICHRIQNYNYPELKVIESDSSVIKKEQLLELQSDFSKSSIEGNCRVYIIKDCDKMNKQASNSLLKFLEEPVDGIIAILLTNHFSKILSTIISRCQIVRLTNTLVLPNHNSLENLAFLCCDNSKDIALFLEDESKKELMETVLFFLEYLEENGLDTLIFMKKIWYNKIQTREEHLLAFMAMIYFYYDVLKCKIGNDSFCFCDKLELIQKIANLNSMALILKKLDVVNYGYEMVTKNLNINLLMDDIVIRLGDCG